MNSFTREVSEGGILSGEKFNDTVIKINNNNNNNF